MSSKNIDNLGVIITDFFIFLFIGLIIGSVLGLIFKSWLIFWLIFLSPVIIVILAVCVAGISKYKNFKAEEIKMQNELDAEKIKMQNMEKEIAEFKTKFEKFNKSKYRDLLTNFVTHLDRDMTPEILWLAFNTTVLDNNFEFLKCKKLLESENARNMEEFISSYSDMETKISGIYSTMEDLNPTSEDLSKFLSKKISDFNPQEMDDFKSLLESKGFNFTVGEIVYLIILEKDKQEYNQLEKQLLLGNAKTLNEYIINFLQYSFDYDDVDVERFNIFLKKQGIDIELNKLKKEIDTIEQKQKLDSFEKKIQNGTDVKKIKMQNKKTKLQNMEKEIAEFKTKFEKFNKSKYRDLLTNFVTHLDRDMTPEILWLAFNTTVLDNNFEFLKCKKLLESENARNMEEFISSYSDMETKISGIYSTKEDLNPTSEDLSKFLSKQVSDFNPQEMGDFKSLLESKGFNFTVGEIVYLIIFEKTRQEQNKLYKQLLLGNAKTLNEYIVNFLQYKFNYDDVDVERFNIFLEKQGIKIKLNKLKQEIDTIKQKQKLDSFEKKILGSSKFTTINDVDLMSGYEFEKFLVKLYTKMNYSIIEHTSLSNDQGADLVVEKGGIKYVIQAKRYNGKVGNDAIQQVVASINHYKADKGVVITNSTFTNSAISLAKSNKIELIDRTKLKELIQNNL